MSQTRCVRPGKVITLQIPAWFQLSGHLRRARGRAGGQESHRALEHEHGGGRDGGGGRVKEIVVGGLGQVAEERGVAESAYGANGGVKTHPHIKKPAPTANIFIEAGNACLAISNCVFTIGKKSANTILLK